MRGRAGVMAAVLFIVFTPEAEAVPAGQKCAQSFGDPKVTQCIDIRGNTPYGVLTNDSTAELCGDLRQDLEARDYGGRQSTYSKRRFEPTCLQPKEKWEVDYSPVDAGQSHRDCTASPCRDVDYWRGMCVQGFQDGQKITRYVCR